MILFGMKDMGGANAILNVVKRHPSHDQVLYADGTSFDRFKNDYPLISASFAPDKILDWFRPKVVITTTCSPGGLVPVALVRAAKERSIKTIVVQDFWGNHLKHKFWDPDNSQYVERSLPDLICVQDEFAKTLVLLNWPGYEEKNILVTGQPAFDRLRDADCDTARRELKETLGLTENWPIVYFSGQLWGMPEAVRATISALNLLGSPVYFILRDHPRIFSQQTPEEVRRIFFEYKDIPQELKHGKVVDSSQIKLGNLISFGADVIMGMYSTAIIEGCYLNKNCLTVWTPGVKDILLMETGNTLHDFPPALCGASLRGTSAEELAANFEKIFRYDTAEMCDAQRKYYFNDGKAALRVYDEIVKIYCS